MKFKERNYQRYGYGYRSRRRRRWPRRLAWLAIFALIIMGVYSLGRGGFDIASNKLLNLSKPERVEGSIVSTSPPETFDKAKVLALSKERYAAAAPAPKYAVTKQLVRYRSRTLDGTVIDVHARVYEPQSSGKITTFMLATGTTGMGDMCSPSLEQPNKADWQNYESHMATLAGQGYLAIVPDYEGMRDPTRIHHYMVGELEGRILLDGLRALGRLESTKARLDTAKLFIGGYSQGGHAAGWADKIAAKYAPDVAPKGIIGFGPVSDVLRTWSDITVGANINWFGPFVLVSYADFYKTTYPLATILQPKFEQTLRQDVLNKCIEAVSYWGPNSAAVYQPAFLEELKTGALSAAYGPLVRKLKENQVWDQSTSTAKLINQGVLDNVILPAQSKDALTKICSNSTGPAALKMYPSATHYNTIALSLNDTLSWVEAVSAGRPVQNDCR